MQQRSVGATGLKVSRLGLGTMTWGRDTDEHEARDQLIAFVDAGGTLLDTAAGYGGGASEELIGSLVGDVVARDEREITGLRAVLNLGHTVGHAIEAASLRSDKPLLHGEAVALGLIAAARLSTRAGVSSVADLEARVTAACARLGLPHELDPWLRPDVMLYLGVDKKRAGTTLGFIAIERPGHVRTLQLTPAQIEGFLRAG